MQVNIFAWTSTLELLYFKITYYFSSFRRKTTAERAGI